MAEALPGEVCEKVGHPDRIPAPLRRKKDRIVREGGRQLVFMLLYYIYSGTLLAIGQLSF